MSKKSPNLTRKDAKDSAVGERRRTPRAPFRVPVTYEVIREIVSPKTGTA